MSGDTINGIPRVDPRARPAAWKRGMQRLVATKPGAAVHRMMAARLDAPIMRATGGRVSLAMGVLPVVVLASTGARSGQRRETPVSYFTDGDDVILMASNYGGARHPSWYHNLLAHPECGCHRQTAVFTIPAKVPVYLANHWVIDVGGRRWEALKLAGQAVVDWDD